MIESSYDREILRLGVLLVGAIGPYGSQLALHSQSVPTFHRYREITVLQERSSPRMI